MARSTISSTASAGPILVTARLMPSGGFSIQYEIARMASTVSDAGGRWSLALERNADIAPLGSWYLVTEHLPPAYGGPATHRIEVGPLNQTLYDALI